MTVENYTWFAIMNRFTGKNPLCFFLLVMALTVFSLSSLSAAGSAEESIDTDSSEMIFPRINSVNLEGRKLKIIATTSFIGDVLLNVAGTAAEITILMPSGQNPHSWEPSPRNLTAIEDADLIFINGLGLEESLIRILDGMKTAPVIPVSSGIDVTGGDKEGEHHHDAVNPHVWFSPLNVIKWAENIVNALSIADPANQHRYTEAAEAYIKELQELDSEIRSLLSVLDPEEKKLVMDHAFFEYYAREYGFEVSGNLIPGMNDQAEPSARDIAALAELVKTENIKAIFVGGTAGRNLTNLAFSVAAETGRDIAVVELLTGSLATAGQRGDSYTDFIRYNTELIVEALCRE